VSVRTRYSLLLVRGDGARVIRLSLSARGAAVTALGVMAVVGLSTAVLGDYLHLRQLTREAAAHAAELAHQRTMLEQVTQRIAALQRETTVWRDRHARIWDALGPDPGLGPRVPGVGGPATAAAARPSPRLFPLESLEQLTETVREEGENLRALEQLMARAGTLLASLPSRWPVRGTVNSEFGARRSPWGEAREFHGGIDIGAQPGTPVHAPAGGVVAFAGRRPDYGLTVVLDHGQDIQSIYGHLSRIEGRLGERVQRGALLGHVGSTGRASGPHLHYEILVKGRPVNPRAYLWE
jgi:murein DD-endopeptidase MepM/ murein hydrolase activator NlpD